MYVILSLVEQASTTGVTDKQQQKRFVRENWRDGVTLHESMGMHRLFLASWLLSMELFFGSHRVVVNLRRRYYRCQSYPGVA